jgi:hypothetical protein
MNPCRQWLRRTSRERHLFLEALPCLVWAKILVHTLPFDRLARRLGTLQTETPRTIIAEERALAVAVSWAVQAVARHVPLGFVCLPQAIAAQWMLRRRGVSTTLYFGVDFQQEKKIRIRAHAWLRAGDKIVTGEDQKRRHQAVEWFGDERRAS